MWKTGLLAFLPQHTLPLAQSRPLHLEGSAGFSELSVNVLDVCTFTIPHEPLGSWKQSAAPSGRATSPSLEEGRNLRSDRLRDTMSTSCCSLEGNKIPNDISVWIKGSLRLSRSTPKRPHCTMTNADDLRNKDKTPNQIIDWDKGSLRSSCSHSKRLQCTMTSRQSIHIVGPIPSVLAHETYRSSSQQAHPNQT